MSDEEALRAIQDGLDVLAENGAFATLIVTLPGGGLIKLSSRPGQHRQEGFQEAGGMVH